MNIHSCCLAHNNVCHSALCQQMRTCSRPWILPEVTKQIAQLDGRVFFFTKTFCLLCVLRSSSTFLLVLSMFAFLSCLTAIFFRPDIPLQTLVGWIHPGGAQVPLSSCRVIPEWIQDSTRHVQGDPPPHSPTSLWSAPHHTHPPSPSSSSFIHLCASRPPDHYGVQSRSAPKL